jgi:hypothetical protein
MEVQAVLTLPHLLLSLELPHHVIHILWLPQEDKQGREGVGGNLGIYLQEPKPDFQHLSSSFLSLGALRAAS